MIGDQSTFSLPCIVNVIPWSTLGASGPYDRLMCWKLMAPFSGHVAAGRTFVCSSASGGSVVYCWMRSTDVIWWAIYNKRSKSCETWYLTQCLCEHGRMEQGPNSFIFPSQMLYMFIYWAHTCQKPSYVLVNSLLKPSSFSATGRRIAIPRLKRQLN